MCICIVESESLDSVYVFDFSNYTFSKDSKLMHLNRLIWYLIAKVMSLKLYMPILINFKIPIFKKKIDGKRGELTNKKKT